MTFDPDRPGRRLTFTLVLRDNADDPSILDIVQQAIRDVEQAPLPAPTVSTPGLPSPSPPVGERVPLSEDVEDRAREAIEEALAKVPVPTAPAFDPAKWAEHLGNVWTLIRQAKALGGEVRVKSDDTPHATS